MSSRTLYVVTRVQDRYNEYGLFLTGWGDWAPFGDSTATFSDYDSAQVAASRQSDACVLPARLSVQYED